MIENVGRAARLNNSAQLSVSGRRDRREAVGGSVFG
jgi:hypothetical protein